MRFLQVEWHKHERDRNSWEIERAEMKARIAKLEGDKHREKRMAEVYYNRIKLLEAAIKKERTARLASEAGESLSDKMVDDVEVDREKRMRASLSRDWSGIADIACSQREDPTHRGNPG